MALQLKTFTGIAAGMLNRFRGVQNRVTDLNVGGVARTIMEAPAAEIDQLYQQMFNGLSDAIPVAIYNSFGFPALGAEASEGLVAVSITAAAAATLIPAGTVLTPARSSLSFVSAADVVIPAGATTGVVLAACRSTGASTNLAFGQSFTLSPAVNGLQSAVNAAPFSGGADAETPGQHQQRFAAYIATIARCGVLAVAYGAKTAVVRDAHGLVVERCRAAVVVEPYVTDPTQPIALIQLYVHNGVGATSDALVAAVQKIVYGYTDASGTKVPGWKAAGVPVQYFKATESPLNLGALVTVAPGFDPGLVYAGVHATLDTYALGLDLGVGWLWAEAVALAMAVPGCINVRLTGVQGDVAVGATAKIMPGVTTVAGA